MQREARRARGEGCAPPWGCCPMPEAICCDDNEHCCPSDLPVCDTDEGRCLPGAGLFAGSKPWARKTPALPRRAPAGIMGRIFGRGYLRRGEPQ
ncbi:Cysteine proteinase RD21a [Tetrabaena socialis]|uniref:Cysteine proteinase RD21a n=1 Tax=Tetrabaena socialis TaxID=47790 RepID=A0A2J8A4H5_9CHLO|nr:Cysteine proteinase RD21a [Tetrabaena socialis]|eukprot:PNH07403.1 Cysteine proteinase RD21a [Tetrabaena socialis]